MTFMDHSTVSPASIYPCGLCSDEVRGIGQNCFYSRVEKAGQESVMEEGVALSFQKSWIRHRQSVGNISCMVMAGNECPQRQLFLM